MSARGLGVSKIPVWIVVLLISFITQAHADFVGYYSLNQFMLVNSESDGTAKTPDNGADLVLTGPNDGSGNPGTADLTIHAAANGIVSFSWSYSSLDSAQFDDAGYLLGSNFTLLADTDGESGKVSFAVAAGDIFGFEMGRVDNQGEPGVLMVSNFSAPLPVNSVPEPVPAILLIAGGAIFAPYTSSLRRASARKRKRSPNFLATSLAFAASAIFGPSILFGQTQTTYSGTVATGLLTLTGTTNLTSLAQQAIVAAKIGPVARTLSTTKSIPAYPEVPVLMPKTLPSPHRSRQNLSQPLGAHSTALTVVGASNLPMNASQGLGIVSGSTAVGFAGISSALERAADNGNEFTIEPPNPAIAVAHGYILEGVNNAVQVYNAAGKPMLPKEVSSNQLFGLAPAIDRTTGIFGPFPTDMRVFYDGQVDRWFVLQRAQDQDMFGDALVTSHLYLAVSQTADPTGTYNVYAADTTDNGRFGCPCLLDYPQIGADAYGFYISANEFDSATQLDLVDSSILAISKAALAAGVSSPPMYRFAVPDVTGYEFAVQPASTPPAASNFVASGGVEYLASTVDGFSGNTVSIWAINNTSSLSTKTPSLQLTRVVIPVALTYSIPESAVQKIGPIPDGASQGFGEASIDGGDTRVQALVYSGGRLYLTFATGTVDASGMSLVGGAYLVLSPTFRSNILHASVLQQDVLFVPGNNLLRPAVAVNAQGQGSITATLVGAGLFSKRGICACERIRHANNRSASICRAWRLRMDSPDTKALRHVGEITQPRL